MSIYNILATAFFLFLAWLLFDTGTGTGAAVGVIMSILGICSANLVRDDYSALKRRKRIIQIKGDVKIKEFEPLNMN